VGPGLGVWSDSTDHVKGVDNLDYFTNQASVWRWRREFQNDFAARMAWTLSPDFARANHPPEVVVNGAQGRSPVAISACEDSTVSVSAAGTSDPDHNGLVYHWWQYREATGGVNPQELVITGADTADARVAIPRTQKPAPNVDTPAEVVYHVVLSVTDDGTPALTRYRRVLLTVPTVGTPAARTLGCGDARQNPTG
jgi:hypothetical protein